MNMHQPGFASTELLINPMDVHVWCASLENPEPTYTQLSHVLSANERERAKQFRFPHLQRRFITARAILRVLLGAYLSVPAYSLEFQYTAYGKPFLETTDNILPIHFNLSHSENLAIYALSSLHPVGVDIEHFRADIDIGAVAKQFFSSVEQSELHESRPSAHAKVFFQYWTRKEAYLKARGLSLALPMNEVNIDFNSHSIGVIKAKSSTSDTNICHTVVDLHFGPGLAAALAIETEERIQIITRKWPDGTLIVG